MMPVVNYVIYDCSSAWTIQELNTGAFVQFFELKKYRVVIFHETGEWCKIWRGMYLPVQNWHEEFKRILTRALEHLKDIPFNGMPLTKVYNVWARSYIWWH